MTKRILYICLLGLILCLGFIPTVEAASKKFVVVIDAGHGGHDPGALGSKAKEKDINLRTALELGRLIERNFSDVRVVYTRKTDVFVPLHQRAVIANNNKADLFISIHTNALPKGRITQGAETYTLGMARANENLEVAKKENSVILMENGYKETYKGFNPNSSESYIIFEFMQDKNMNQSINFAKKIQQQFKRNGRVDKGVHQAGFLVLRETAMPSVLVELGYISTPAEESFLSSQDGTNQMARSIYNAFVNYKSNRNVTGFETEESTPAPVAQAETVAPLVTESAAITSDDDALEVHPIRDNSHLSRKARNSAKEESVLLEPEVNVQTTKDSPAAAKNNIVSSKESKTNVQNSTVATKEKKTEEQPKKETVSTTASSNAPVFKIQILTSPKKLPAKDRQFKGLKVDFYKDGTRYKYTYYESTNYNEVYQKKKEVATKFKDCFIVAFKKGKLMDVNEAIKEFKNRKK